MIVKKLTTCLVLMSAVFAIGCSSSGGSSTSTTSGAGAANGTWQRGCTIDDPNINLSDGVYEVSTLTFSGGTWTGTILSYTDEACTIPDAVHELVFNGTVAYPGGTTSTSLGEAQHMNVTTTGATLDGVPPPVNVFPITDYEIFLISGSNIYFGGDDGVNIGETAATRPTIIDTVYFFTRQ